MKLRIALPLCFLLSPLAWSQNTTLSSTNLPIVIINTGGKAILDEPKVVVDMGIIYNGPGVKNNLGDPRNHYNGKIGIERRGSSSQSFPKTQYGVELRDALDQDLQAPLLGLPTEEDWILFAPYNDKSLMRDVLAYKFAREMNRYASRFRYCEVVIDNDYKGVYVLLEKIKRDPMRVDISDLDPDENTGDELTGGYILKIDKTSGGSGSAGFASAYNPSPRTGLQVVYFQYEYPRGDEITAAQMKYISDFMKAFESTMKGSNWADPINGYKRYIDMPSFIDYFIMNELTKNPDGYRLSTFMYKEKDSQGGKLHMGPVWDFNLGFGNVNYCTNWQHTGFAKDFNTICPGDNWLIPFWWETLWNDADFRGPLYSRWTALRSGPLQTSKVFSFIDSVANVLSVDGAQQRNFQRWPVLGKYIWPNPPAYSTLTTYDSEVNWLKTWIAQRLAWLDDNLVYIVSDVKDIESTNTITPFPNPFGDELAFQCTVSDPSTVVVDVCDVLGRTVKRLSESYTVPGSFVMTSSSADLANGIYLYRASVNGSNLSSGRIVKDRSAR